jgi:hypothetical protein
LNNPVMETQLLLDLGCDDVNEETEEKVRTRNEK